jgi:4-hydroxy-4-methyl-2-oxoglutarate aldolase
MWLNHLFDGLTSYSTRAQGAFGALVDGGKRDSGIIIEMGSPVFAKYRFPVEAFGTVIKLEHYTNSRFRRFNRITYCQSRRIYFCDLDGAPNIPKAITLRSWKKQRKLCV